MTSLYFSNVELDQTGLGNGRVGKSGSAIGWVRPKMLSTSAGSSAGTTNTATVAGPSSGIDAGYSAASLLPARQWLSPPLAEGVTISGTIDITLYGYESSMSANAAFGCKIEKISGVTLEATTISDSLDNAELTTGSGTANSWSATPTSTALSKGDRIRIVVYIDDAPGATMGSNYTTYFQYGDATWPSVVSFTETLSFMTFSGVSFLYLSADPPSISTSDVDYTAGFRRGITGTTLVTNTVNGFTSAIQMTATAGGSPVVFWTSPLNAATLAGMVQVYAYSLASNANANANLCCELAVTNEDGSSPVVYGVGIAYQEVYTSAVAQSFYIAGNDLNISARQRIRVTLKIDDTENTSISVVEKMTTGYTVTLQFGGSLGGSYDTYIQLPIELSTYYKSDPPVNWHSHTHLLTR